MYTYRDGGKHRGKHRGKEAGCERESAEWSGRCIAGCEGSPKASLSRLQFQPPAIYAWHSEEAAMAAVCNASTTSSGEIQCTRTHMPTTSGNGRSVSARDEPAVESELQGACSCSLTGTVCTYGRASTASFFNVDVYPFRCLTNDGETSESHSHNRQVADGSVTPTLREEKRRSRKYRRASKTKLDLTASGEQFSFRSKPSPNADQSNGAPATMRRRSSKQRLTAAQLRLQQQGVQNGRDFEVLGACDDSDPPTRAERAKHVCRASIDEIWVDFLNCVA